MRPVLALSLLFSFRLVASAADAPASRPMPTFTANRPASIAEWEQRRGQLRSTLWRLLGEMPPLFTPEAETLSRESRDGYTVEKFSFDNRAGDTVYGYLLVPAGGTGKLPAILYNHYHTSHTRIGKEEIINPGSIEALGDKSPGDVLARAGYVVMCIDAYSFGERRHAGPGGDKDNGNQTEESFFKLFLWQGRTLWGMMVRDDILALNLLANRPEVDSRRLGAMGFSMGATRTWWIAALDERIQAAVSGGCLTRYQNLVEAGNLRHQSIFYFIPNVLKERIDMEEVVGLIAPRAHLTLTGDRDDGSPVEGVRIINRFQEDLYRLYGRPERFRGIVYPDTGHEYTPEMWQETMGWLDTHLK